MSSFPQICQRRCLTMKRRKRRDERLTRECFKKATVSHPNAPEWQHRTHVLPCQGTAPRIRLMARHSPFTHGTSRERTWPRESRLTPSESEASSDEALLPAALVVVHRFLCAPLTKRFTARCPLVRAPIVRCSTGQFVQAVSIRASVIAQYLTSVRDLECSASVAGSCYRMRSRPALEVAAFR